MRDRESMGQETPAGNSVQRQTHLFTVRLWREPVDLGQPEFRGEVKHVLSGEVEYFRGWKALEAFFTAQLINAENDPMT